MARSFLQDYQWCTEQLETINMAGLVFFSALCLRTRI
jgi:hypothetical protein